MSLSTIDEIKAPEDKAFQALRLWLFDHHAGDIWNIAIVQVGANHELVGSLHSEKVKTEIVDHLASLDPFMKHRLAVEGVFQSPSNSFDYLL